MLNDFESTEFEFDEDAFNGGNGVCRGGLR